MGFERTHLPPRPQSAQILLVVRLVKTGCEPPRRRSAAAGSPAPSGAPQTSQVAVGLVARTRRPAVMAALSTALSRVTTLSGQAATQASHAVQREGSKLRRSDLPPVRSAASAPVGQTATQTSHREQPATSIPTIPSEQPGPSARHLVRAGSRAPSTVNACIVASGSRNSIRTSPAACALFAAPDSPGASGGDRRPATPSGNGRPGTTGGTGLWTSGSPAPRGPSGRKPSTSASCPRKLASSPARFRQSPSSHATTPALTPALANWRSHPAVTISSDGTRSTNHCSPSRGPVFECWQASATPVADLRRPIDSTRTPAAAPNPSKPAPGRAKAPLRQAVRQAPQPWQ